MKNKNELFELFDWMLVQEDLYFDYFNWSNCFIAHYSNCYCVYVTNWSSLFGITIEQFNEMFCNIDLPHETAHDIKFHVNRIKEYIKENNL